MSKYPLKDSMSLRDVYLIWLIALDSVEMARENNLNTLQLIAFRDFPHKTWGEFKALRSEHNV